MTEFDRNRSGNLDLVLGGQREEHN